MSYEEVTPAEAQVFRRMHISFRNCSKQCDLTELLSVVGPLAILGKHFKFLNKHGTMHVTINSTIILYFKFTQILAVFIFIVSALMSSLKQLPGVYKL